MTGVSEVADLIDVGKRGGAVRVFDRGGRQTSSKKACREEVRRTDFRLENGGEVRGQS